jgi:hypothetical protein
MSVSTWGGKRFDLHQGFSNQAISRKSFQGIAHWQMPIAVLSLQSILPSWRWADSLSISGVHIGSKTIATFTFLTPGR